MTTTPGRAPDRLVKDVVTRQGSAYSSSARLVALAIADHLNAEGVAWPSVARLCAWTGLQVSAVKVALRCVCEGELALFERRMTTGRGSCTYRLRDDAGTPGRQTTPSFNDPVVSRPGGGRLPTPTGSLNDPGTPNRTPTRTPERKHPPTPAHERGRPLPSSGQLVWQRWLEAEQIGAGGVADKRWRRWCGEQLRQRGIEAGAELVQDTIRKGVEDRRRQAAEATQLAEAHAAERDVLEHARREGQPAGELWTRFVAALEARVNAHAFGTWFRFLEPVAVVRAGGVEHLVVAAPSAQHCSWIERNYQVQVLHALRDIGREDLALDLLPASHSPPGASRAG